MTSASRQPLTLKAHSKIHRRVNQMVDYLCPYKTLKPTPGLGKVTPKTLSGDLTTHTYAHNSASVVSLGT
jgi:hypothetical protein